MKMESEIKKEIKRTCMNRIVVYTTIFGDYDVLLDPKYISKDCDYICFTDKRNLKSSVWQVINVVDNKLPPRVLNRKFKILPHLYFPHHTYSIYVDANVEIIGNIKELVDKYLQRHYMACLKHPERDCIYQEAEVCIKLQLDEPERIKEQMARYKQAGYPEHYGLTDNSVLLRRHNEPLIIKVMESWWKEIEIGSKRDQLSFGFVAWKHGLQYVLMEENRRIPNAYFRWHPHKIRGINDSLWKAWLHLRVNRDRSVIYAVVFKIVQLLGRFVKMIYKHTK